MPCRQQKPQEGARLVLQGALERAAHDGDEGAADAAAAQLAAARQAPGGVARLHARAQVRHHW